ncbi:MAG: sigma-70 family RNA polymerase sigma factor [Dehalococcoidia bacterium]
MDIDEADLIARARQGDLDAFNHIVEQYQQSVYNLSLRMLTSPQAAEDATQEAFIAAYRAIGSYRGGSFRSWLFRIATNACYDELRRRRSRPALSLDAPHGPEELPIDLPQPGPSLEEHVQRLEFAGHLQEALGALPADQRLAVVLCDVQGFDYSEIAQVTGVSLGTVKSRIARARARLRKLLGAHRELFTVSFRPSNEGS